MKVQRSFDPEPWRAELLAFVRRMGAAQAAEDNVQEAFLRALESPPERQPRTWLYRVALNVLRDRARRQHVRSAGSSEELARAVEPAPGRAASALAQDGLRRACGKIVLGDADPFVRDKAVEPGRVRWRVEFKHGGVWSSLRDAAEPQKGEVVVAAGQTVEIVVPCVLKPDGE